MKMDDVLDACPDVGKKIHIIRCRIPFFGVDSPLRLVGLGILQELCSEDMGQFEPSDFKKAMEQIYGG